MTMQRLCHFAAVLNVTMLCVMTSTARGDTPMHDYPTHARVEFVNECVAMQRSELSKLYQCSCVIDQIARKLSYDDFVEASTFSRYASLAGEAGAIFRDSDHARSMAKLFKQVETEAYNTCNLKRR